MKHVGYVVLSAFLCVAAGPASVYGQVSDSLTQGASMPVSTVSPSGALAAGTNPAGMTDVDGWALTYAHQEGPRVSLDSAVRDSVWAAFQAGSHAAFGTGFNVERPTALGVPDHGSLIFSGALQADPSFSLGTTWRIRMPRGQGDATHTADVSMVARPATSVAILLGGQNLAVGGADVSGFDIQRRAVFGIDVRPLGDQRLNLELLGSVAEGGNFGFRGQAGVFVPYMGELLVSAELQERGAAQDWLLSAGARVVLGNAALAAQPWRMATTTSSAGASGPTSRSSPDPAYPRVATWRRSKSAEVRGVYRRAFGSWSGPWSTRAFAAWSCARAALASAWPRPRKSVSP